MSSEQEITLSFLFKRSGKNQMSFSELYLSLSMDLKWFAPTEAKNFVKSALNQKLLKKDGDFLKPVFDYEKIVIPLGFTPSKKILETANKEKAEDVTVFKMIFESIVEKTSLNEEEIMNMINAVEDEKNVSAEVAALLIAMDYGVVLDGFIDKVEKEIFK